MQVDASDIRLITPSFGVSSADICTMAAADAAGFTPNARTCASMSLSPAQAQKCMCVADATFGPALLVRLAGQAAIYTAAHGGVISAPVPTQPSSSSLQICGDGVTQVPAATFPQGCPAVQQHGGPGAPPPLATCPDGVTQVARVDYPKMCPGGGGGQNKLCPDGVTKVPGNTYPQGCPGATSKPGSSGITALLATAAAAYLALKGG